MSLNTRYFKTLYEQHDDSFTYELVRPLNNPMILFSKVDHTPLAAVAIQTRDSTAKSIITKRPDKYNGVDFQGFISQDNQKFEIIITNLTEYNNVKIDIMKVNTAVRDTDPGPEKGGLNNVNELNSFQSYAIKGDQKDSRALILQAIKSVHHEHVTVGQSEDATKNMNDWKGTYYYIAVTPKAGVPELVDKFKDTYWDCVDTFCIKRRRTVYSDDEDFDSHPITYSMTRNFGYSGGGYRPYSATRNFGYSGGLMPCSINESYDEASDRGNDLMTQGLSEIQSQLPPTYSVLSKNIQHDINTSLASNVVSGEIVHTAGNKTGLTYYYDVPSNIDGQLCTLCLSVAPQVEFVSYPENFESELIQSGKTLIDTLIKGEYDKLMKNVHIYDTPECVVCMENDTNVVFYQCGHKCCHRVCANSISKCPLCRQHITAKLSV